MKDLKKEFHTALLKRLNKEEQKLSSLISYTGAGKKSLVVQMPIGVIALTPVWEKMIELATQMKIELSQMVDNYATLEDLDKILGKIEWMWDKWIPIGFLTMIAGDSGVGKSAIMQHLTKLITMNECFPLQEQPLGKPRSVVWIDTESSQQILKVRANTMGIDKKRVYIPTINGDILTQPDLAVENNREHIINMIEAVSPAMLVLDSLSGSHSKGENKVEEIRPMLNFLAALARDYQMAAVLVHHLSKTNRNESPELTLFNVRGSTHIPAMCRVISVVEKAPDGKLLLRQLKNNLSKLVPPILVTPQLDFDGEFRGFLYEAHITAEPVRTKKELCAEWVIAQLENNRDAKKGIALTKLIELGEQVGYSRQNLYSVRYMLQGRIMYSGTGNKAYWKLRRTSTEAKNEIMGNNGKKSKKRSDDDEQGE